MSAAEAPQRPSTAPNPPSDLVARGRGRRFWRSVTSEFEADPHDLELLAEGCRMLDLLDAIRDELDDQPLLLDGRTNPLLVESRLIRAELRLLLGRFGWDEDEPSRRARRAANARWGR